MNQSELQKTALLESRQDGLHTMRIQVAGGDFTPLQLRVISDVAQHYGRGKIHFTVKQEIEIHGVAQENIETAKNVLAASGICCKGSAEEECHG